MRRINKILSVFLAIMMVVSAAPVTVSAAETAEGHQHTKKIIPEFAPTETTKGLTAGIVCSTCGEILVEQQIIPALGTTDDSSVIVSGTCGSSVTWTYNKETFALIISGFGDIEKYTSAQVRPWEKYLKEIKTVIINKGITKINNYAFEGLTNVTYVSIPDSVITFGSYIFKNCKSLVSVTIPDSVTSATGLGSFDGCASLVQVSIGNNVTMIDKESFKGCSSLVNVTIPDNVYYIMDSAFENCSNLKTVTLGKKTSSIYNKAFNSCTSLTDVYYRGTEEEWNNVSIAADNAPLENATIHFNNSDDNSGSVDGHNHSYEIVTKEPTCTESGYTTFTCECGDIFTVSHNALGHNMVIRPATVPTLESDGHTRGEKCSACGLVKLEEKVIPALPNEESFATLQGDNLIGVLDMVAGTLTVYGTGTIKAEHNFTTTYDKELKENISYDYYVDTVIITDGITGIGDSAFEYSPLNKIIIADTVKSIGADAFYQSDVDTVVIGDGVETIGADAFRGCYWLSDIELGENVKTIGVRAFWACDNLTAIKVDSENPYISVDEYGVLYGENETKLILCLDTIELTDYVMADTVTEICSYAFFSNPTLKSITIPDCITKIGTDAFYQCDNLEEVYYSGTPEQWMSVTIGDYNKPLLNSVFHFGSGELGGVAGEKAMWLFDETTGTFTVFGTGEMYDYTLLADCPWHKYRDEIKTVVIGDGITVIGDSTFSDCDILTNVIISDTVTTIQGFESCDSLESISIPYSVKTIGDSAFRGCIKLKEVVIPNSVTTIGYYAFQDCTSLTSIVIPDSVTEVSPSAFKNCTSLTTATLGSGLITVSSEMFCGCYNLQNVSIGRNVDVVSSQAFFGCRSLRMVTLPEGLNTIRTMAFRGCTGLTIIIIPKSVTSIQENAFTGCDMLTDIYYSGSEELWNKNTFHSSNVELVKATKHYNSSTHTHYFETLVMQPTCTEGGYTVYFCRCGYQYNDDFTDPTGHSYTPEITKPATHTTTGEITYRCHCDDTYTETIDKLPEHDYVSVVTAPSCTEQGYTTYTCECGDSYITDYVAATGHNYVDNTCANCGDEKVILNGVVGDYFYRDNVKLKAYQLVEFNGDFYFINDSHKIAKNMKIYLGTQFVEGFTYVDGTPLQAGYYEFDADGKMIRLNGVVGDYFYRDNVKLKAYQLVEFEGNFYFINDSHKVAKNKKLYLGENFVSGFTYADGTPLQAGYYEFDADGKMIRLNGVVGDYFYRDNVKLKAYQLVEFEGNFYFINDSHKVAKNKKLYLGENFVSGFTYADGTPLQAGYYEFDADGKMIRLNGVVGDYFYRDNVKLKAYQLVEFEGNFYFINDSHKVAKNKKLYLGENFVSGFTYADGTPLQAGYYEFDADGKMIF